MQRLYAVLTNDEVVARLIDATSPEDLLAIDELVDEDKLTNDQIS